MRTQRKSYISILLTAAALLLIAGSAPVTLKADDLKENIHFERLGEREIHYSVKDIHSIIKPYNYVIGESTPLVLDIFGILAVMAACGFAAIHGYARYRAHKKNPLKLVEVGKEHIYSLNIRIRHWLNTIATIILIISGFMMHYAGPSNSLGFMHNLVGVIMVGLYILFITYEIATLDLFQYFSQDWELKEGILNQALFYIRGIFKQEEHPYHKKKHNRLNPLQKMAYFILMFGLMPLVIITGVILLRPQDLDFIVKLIALENMKYVLMTHLAGAFGMVAFTIAHVYLGTTGDTIRQDFEVIVNGYHRVYKYKKE